MEKECFKCKIVKPLTDFYVHKQMKDGHLNKCKNCTKNDVRGNTIENSKNPEYKENERKRGRMKYKRLYQGITKRKNPIYNIRYIEKYPEKNTIRYISKNIKNPDKTLQKHHWSYNIEDALNVIWLTAKQHKKAHRFIIYDQERKMYRRYDNNLLLDSFELHNQFIIDCINNKED